MFMVTLLVLLVVCSKPPVAELSSPLVARGCVASLA
jgi:hypothetical protein